MRSFIFQAKDGKADFLTDYNRASFYDELKKNEGKKYRVKQVTPSVSDNRRGWYFGAVIPFLRDLNGAWKELSNDQIHEILKQEFNGFQALGIDGKVTTYGMSAVASDVSSEVFDNYILRISEWLNENYGGLQLPDSEHYKKHFRDTVLEEGEELPKIDYPESTGDIKF